MSVGVGGRAAHDDLRPRGQPLGAGEGAVAARDGPGGGARRRALRDAAGHVCDEVVLERRLRREAALALEVEAGDDLRVVGAAALAEPAAHGVERAVGIGDAGRGDRSAQGVGEEAERVGEDGEAIGEADVEGVDGVEREGVAQDDERVGARPAEGVGGGAAGPFVREGGPEGEPALDLAAGEARGVQEALSAGSELGLRGAVLGVGELVGLAAGEGKDEDLRGAVDGPDEREAVAFGMPGGLGGAVGVAGEHPRGFAAVGGDDVDLLLVGVGIAGLGVAGRVDDSLHDVGGVTSVGREGDL